MIVSADNPPSLPNDGRPTVYILSDSLGETADQVAKAAISQFEPDTFRVVRVPKIASALQLSDVVKQWCHASCVFFYTFADPHLRDAMRRLMFELDVKAVDIMGPGVKALAGVAGVEPTWEVGAIRKTDRGYFQKIESLEFAVMHDDGRHVEGLNEAEIVLIGVSRTSKTPLSMYLAFQGYKVANVPLMVEVDTPPELFELDSRKVFGLVSDADVLTEIRTQRLSDLGGYARRYAERAHVEAELDEARAVMRRIGCIVVSTANRAIEETAHEILRYREG